MFSKFHFNLENFLATFRCQSIFCIRQKFSMKYKTKNFFLIKENFFWWQVFLEHREKDEVGQLVSAKTHGATPLVMACRNGHYDVAEYLIEKCGADIEQTGTGKFEFFFFCSHGKAGFPRLGNSLSLRLKEYKETYTDR